MPLLVALNWQRATRGYDLVERGPVAGQTIMDTRYGGTFVVPRGEPSAYLLRGHEDGKRGMVCVDLAKTPCTPKGVQMFVNKWGLLYDYKEMMVSEFYPPIENLHALLDAAARKHWGVIERHFDERGVGKMDLRFRRFPGQAKPRLCLQPMSLMSFCWVQAWQLISAEGEFKRCSTCGQFFASGTPTGGRSTRQYCSDACRVRKCRQNAKRRRTRAA